MPASPPDHDPSPSSPADPPADDQEDAAVNESTPFLPSEDGNPLATTPLARTVRIVTTLALTFSILTLASLFATAIARQVGPVSFDLPWQTTEGINGVVAPAIFSLLFSAYNVRRLRSHKTAAPLPLNVIVDILIAFFAITYGAGGLAGLQSGQGGWCSYADGGWPSCRRRALPVLVFAGSALGAGVILGAMHLVLFCVRCRIAYGSGLGRSPWSLPFGQVKLEFSIKFLKEPEREGREEAV